MLGKKERHEIRRKVRRAEAVGEIRLDDSTDPLGDLDAFIDLHQRRWGAAGLFPPTAGRRPEPGLHPAAVRAGRRRRPGPPHLPHASAGGGSPPGSISRPHDGYLYYNAGVDPDARELSPGVVMVHAYVQRAIADGKRRLDFLRGDEPYKYEWGAVDEPIQRLLVRRRAA